MKLLKFFKKNPSYFLVFLGLISVTAFIAAAGFYYRVLEGRSLELAGLRNGVNVCTSRVAQSFFAQSNGAGQANSLSRNFLSSSDECFYSLDEKVKKLAFINLKESSIALYDEFLNFKNILSASEVNLQLLAASYNKIDQQRFSLGVSLAQKSRELQDERSIYKYALIASVILLGILSFVLLVLWSHWDNKLKDIEQQAEMLMTDFVDNSARIERLIERVFDQIQLPLLKNLFQEYHHHVLEKAYSPKKRIEISKQARTQVFRKGESEFDEDTVQIVVDPRSNDERTLLKKISQKVQKMGEKPTKQSITDEDFTDVSLKVVEELKQSPSNVAVDNNGIQNGLEMLLNTLKRRATSDKKELASSKIVFSENFKDFMIKPEAQDGVYQFFYGLFQRVFSSKGVAQIELMVSEYETFDKNFGQITLKSPGILLNVAELEYFNSGKQNFKNRVNSNLIMAHELLISLGGDFFLSNRIGENSENYAEFRVQLPQEVVEIAQIGEATKTTSLTRLVKGSKKLILQKLGKENTI
jgi:hypothetical protein